ncbi:MAG TPA: MoaD/ThiS family protein [Tepidisphaeraceae bacterium]|jgi:hypothetical protein
MVRVIIPPHLQALSGLAREIPVDVPPGSLTQRVLLDSLESQYPALQGTIRDHGNSQRRPLVRFFACEEDVSHVSPDAPLPEAVASGKEPFIILGAIAGG